MGRVRHYLQAGLPPLLIAVAALFLVDRLSWRIDLTQDRLFSLNEATLKQLHDLPNPVQVQVYFSRELPPRFQSLANFVMAQLAEYELHSGGKCSVTYLDPDELSNQASANELGIYETRANLMSESGIQVVRLWFGLALLYEGQAEVFSTVQSIENFEYDITAALVRLSRRDKPRLQLVGPTYSVGRGVIFDIEHDIKPIYKELTRSFKVEQVRLDSQTQLALGRADALVVWSLHSFSEQQLYALEQYILSGGPVLLLVSGMRIDPNLLQAQALPLSRADAFYAHLGFAVNRDLVCDQSCTKIKYTDVRPPVLASYPLFPELSHATKGLDNRHETTADLKRLVIPWASSMRRVADSHALVQEIAHSSDQAWRLQEWFNIDPKTVPGPSFFERYTLGLAISGSIPAFFPKAPESAPVGEHLSGSKHPATVLVWSSEHLLTQSRDVSVLAWISRTVSYLALRDELAGIDRRENAFRPIVGLNAKQRRNYRWLSVFPVPALLLLIAVIRTARRRYSSSR